MAGSGSSGTAGASAAGAATMGSAGLANGADGGGGATQGAAGGSPPGAGGVAAGSGVGAAGTTAGGASAAGAAGATNGGASSACGASALFCEDFETLADGPAQKTSKWEPVGSTLTLDATHARGKRALHISTQASADAYIRVSTFSPPGNSFFGRFYLYATAFPSAPNYAHYTLVEAAGTGNSSLLRFIGGQYIAPQGALWGVGSDGGPTGDWTSWKASAPSEAGKWLCMEWEAAAPNNTVHVWIDGEAKTDLTVSTTMNGGSGNFVFPTFNKISIGWWLYQENATPSGFNLWFDDIALSTQRLGCN